MFLKDPYPESALIIKLFLVKWSLNLKVIAFKMFESNDRGIAKIKVTKISANPNLKDKKVLDLGCGYGWHCIYAMENAASSVVGNDISHKMLKVAKEKTCFSQVEYKCCAIEDVDFPAGSFDIIISSLAFHYVEDYGALIKNIYNMLKINGSLVFTVEHPVFTAYGTQDWYYDEKGEILHFPVDNYYYEGKRAVIFLEEKVIKYHRTLITYLNMLLMNGFIIEQVVEPQPPEDMIDIPGMKNEMRRPMMLIVSAKKQEKTRFELLAEQFKGERLNPKLDIDWDNPVGKEVW